MGVEDADSRGSGYAPARRLGGLNAVGDHVGALVLHRGGGAEACNGREGAGWLATVWAGVRRRVTSLRVLTSGAAAVAALGFMHPAAYHLPSLDAATASLITMLALVAAVLFGTQAARPEGFGMRSMRERAATLDGRLTVQQRRSGGTELQVLIP